MKTKLNTISAILSGCAVGGAGAFIGAAQVQNPPATLEASAFILRDQDGRKRGEFAMVNHGADRLPTFQIFDEKGQTRVMLRASSEAADFALLTPAAPGAEERSIRCFVLAQEGEMVGGYIADSKGHPKFQFGHQPEFGAILQLIGGKMNPMVEVIANADGSSLRLKDEQGKVIWEANPLDG